MVNNCKEAMGAVLRLRSLQSQPRWSALHGRASNGVIHLVDAQAVGGGG
jgi:hypothetical protein